jgi:NAD(P)-dependent dehydrogenase (short-subunit alcohol dehydrogenase family)
LTPSGVLTQPFHITQAITFLLSNESSQINGTTLTLDGGFIKI